MNYEFHPEAEREFIDQAAHYESEVPGLGSRFADEVDRVIKLLYETPQIGAPVDEELRHFVLRRFPHSMCMRFSARDSLSLPSLMEAGSRDTGGRERAASCHRSHYAIKAGPRHLSC